MSRREFGNVSYSFTPTLAPVPSLLKSSLSSPSMVSVATTAPSSPPTTTTTNNNNTNNNNNGNIFTITTKTASPSSPLLNKLQNNDNNIVVNNTALTGNTHNVWCSKNLPDVNENNLIGQWTNTFNTFHQINNNNSNNNSNNNNTDQMNGLSASANDFTNILLNSKTCLSDFQFYE